MRGVGDCILIKTCLASKHIDCTNHNVLETKENPQIIKIFNCTINNVQVRFQPRSKLDQIKVTQLLTSLIDWAGINIMYFRERTSSNKMGLL